MKWFMLLLAAWLVMTPVRSPAQEVCNGTMDNVVFGQVDTLGSVSTDVSGNFKITCTGILSPNIRACVSLGSPTGEWPRPILNGTDKLTYEIYSDAARTTVWDGFLHNASGVVVADMPMTSGAGTVLIPYYARLVGGQTNAPAGAYSVNWTTADTKLNFAGYATTPQACQGWWTSTKFTFTVTATVASNCTISASNVDFGSIGLLRSPVNATGLITVTCTKGSTYSLSLNAGTGAGATVASRLLTRGGGGTLSYGLYKDSARSQSWGDGTGGTTTVSSIGTGVAQTQTVYATLPAQTAALGAYSDTIVVTVTY